MAEDLPFKAEYAKSNRSSCKLCREKIAKDSLRVAKMVQSPHFDGKIPNWFHFSCFFRKQKVKNWTDIWGFDSLRWEDQEKVKAKIEGGGGGGNEAPSADALENGVSDDLLVEYAKSNRSKCKNCKEQIDKGEIRLAKVQEPDAESNAPAGMAIPWWHHVDCFVQCRESLSVDSSVTGESFTGFTKLNKEDKALLKRKLGKGAKTKGKGSKRKAVAVDETDAKRKKTAEEDEIQKQLKEQSKRLWKVRDDLQKNCSSQELKEMLEDNGMSTHGGESLLLDRCSDGMRFGRLLPCEECSGGQLVYRTEGYCCTGNLTAWTKCMFVTKDPKRASWKISDDLKEASDFLKNFKCKKRQRIFPTISASTTASPKRIKSEAVEANNAQVVSALSPEKPLSGMTLAVIGRLKQNKGKLSTAIEDLGGSVVEKVNNSVDCCISSQAEVDKKSKKMQDAERFDVPVVSEDYLEAVRKGGARSMITQHSIASWGNNKAGSAVDGAVVFNGSGSKVMKSGLEGAFAKKMKIAVKGGAAVDPDSEMEDRCHVFQENGNIYSATLGLVDIVRGANSYYKLQLLKDDKKNSYHLFRSWGRVGTHIGGTKLERCDSKADAIRSFLNLYGEKTGNSWEDRKNFVKRPNKFYPLEIDYGQDNEELKSSIAAGSKSLLAPAIQELIKMIFDVESMKKTLIEFEIDLKKMPLGKLTKRQIETAYAVLGEAQKLISDGRTSSSLLDASNRFYTLIPHDFGMKKPPLLDNLELIKTKVRMLDNLLDIEVAYSLLKSGEDDRAKDPLDVNYEKLKTDLEVLAKDSKEFSLIDEYVKNTHAETHKQYELNVLEVFKVNRHGEVDRFQPFKELHNRRLLWHGSRTTNYAGILSQGLRIAPPEAPVTGYMFGKGVYFADMVSKSANYCRTTPSDNIGLLMLCEVALGNMHELLDADNIVKLPKGKHSVKGCGRTGPDPASDVTLKDGTVVPCGKGTKTTVSNSSLLYNEYIVYDVAQINIKYLLKVEFKYKYGF
ncbi:poly [ADP-ribose] polymerase 1-like [Acropora muricata]|uniref:poly [ADP-ribose] polymerase 1-like n=1 Tax=Acropora muricata TaxID=159855 RepID=UPI0034E41EFE